MSIDNPGHSVNTYFIPVDNKLEEFTVSVSGKQPDIKLWSPGQGLYKIIMLDILFLHCLS